MIAADLIKALQDVPPDTKVGVARGLSFAPLSEVHKRHMSTKYTGQIDRFDGETEGGDAVIKLTFLNNTEIAMLYDEDSN